MNYATGLAFLAVFLWSTLAVSAVSLTAVPVFLQLGIAFLGPGLIALTPQTWKLKQKRDFIEILLSALALFAYHAFLFLAFRLANPFIVNVINYLWPFLLILATPLFFSEKKLNRHHFFSALLCLIGVALLFTDESQQKIEITGFILAFFAALTWPLYSLGKAKFSSLPESVALPWSCLITSLLFFLLASFEGQTSLALDPRQALILLWMSLGPFGLAFYFWSLALKHGDPRWIGLISYLTPVLSTVLILLTTSQAITEFQLLGSLFALAGLIWGGFKATPKTMTSKDPSL